MKKNFYRLFYRRNIGAFIEDIVCVNGNVTVTKAGAHFETPGYSDFLSVGATIIIDSITYRVAVINSNISFDLSVVFASANNTYDGTVSTPALSNMLGSEMITEVDAYWKELPKTEIGAFAKVEKGDTQPLASGDNPVISEIASLEFNVLGFQEYSATAEGRFDTLRTAINQLNTDILLFNYEVSKPNAIAYYGIFGNVGIETGAGALPKIVIALNEEESIFGITNIQPFLFTIEDPVLDPSSGASVLDVTISCETQSARMYMTITGATPTEADEYVENYEVYEVPSGMTVKVKAFKNGMTESAVGSGTYT